MAKKKKDADFKKVKLKVGRKLTRGDNETKTDFKAKKLVIKEAKSLGKDPIQSLINALDANTMLKILCLSKVSDGFLSLNPKLISGQLISVLARLLLDHEPKVRIEAKKCIQLSIASLEKASLDLEPMISILICFLKCGLTHINKDICSESRNLLKVLIPKLPASLQGEFMATLMARFINGSHPDVVDYELSNTLLELIKAEENTNNVTEVQVLTWSKDNNHLNLRANLKPALAYDFSFKTASIEESREKFMSVLSQFVAQELTHVNYRKEGNWAFTPLEARLFIAVAKISTLLECDQLPLHGTHPSVSVMLDSALSKNRKQVALIASYEDQINKLLPLVYSLTQ